MFGSFSCPPHLAQPLAGACSPNTEALLVHCPQRETLWWPALTAVTHPCAHQPPEALVGSPVKAVFCRHAFHTWLWKTFSHPNSHICRGRMRRRDRACIKSFFLLFTAYVAFVLNPVSILLYSGARKCCYILFCIISLEIIPGSPASNTGTPLVRCSSADQIGLP